MKINNSKRCHCEERKRRGNLKGRDCFTSFAMTICLLFAFAVPAFSWTQTDWSGGDSQCLWYAADRYDTSVNIDDACVINSDSCISIINAGEGAGNDTGVLLSSTYDADSPVVWKTIEWNFPSTEFNPDKRGDSRLRKDENDLVALWHFDEGENLADDTSADDSTVYDESANENTGVVHGCVWGKWTEPSSTADAVFGSALYFDGIGNYYVAVPSSTSLSDDITNAGAITIEAWVNSLSDTGSASTVYDFSSGANSDKWGWRCDNLTNIANLVPGTETALNDIALADVASDDASYDEAGDSHDIKYHRFKFTIGEDEADITQIQVTWIAHDEYAPNPIRTSNLYIWDFDGSPAQWVLLDSFNSNDAKHTYIGTLTGGLAKYVDSSGFLYVLGVSAKSGPPEYLETYYVKVEVSYAVPSHPEINISKSGSYGIGATLTTAAAFINGQIISYGDATTPIPLGWNHIALTYNKDAEEMKLYVNGIEEATDSYASNIVSNSNDFLIGSQFNGSIDEVAIYNRAKTAEEIWQDARGTQIQFRTQTTSSILDGTGADSPVGLWHFDNLDFDNPSSTVAHDSSAYPNNGTIYGAKWSQYGVFGKCLQFDGNDYVEMPDSTSLDITSDITIEAWIKPNQQSIDNDSIVVSKLMLDWSRYAIGTRRSDAEPYPYFVLYKAVEDENYLMATSALTVGEWTHIAGTWDDPSWKIYINGELSNSSSLSGSLDPFGGNLLIGGHSSTKYFNGLIDEVGIYPRAKTAKEIAIDARGGQPWSPWSSPYYKKGDEDDIVLFADDFNDGETSNWTIESGTGNWTIDNADGVLEATVAAADDTGIFQATNTDWYTYQVETEVKLSSTGQAGVFLNWNNGTAAGYVALLDLYKLRLYGMDANGYALGTLHKTYTFSSVLDTNTRYTLKAQYDGTHIRVYLGDTNHITYNAPADYTYKGYAGLLASTTGATATVCFNDFKVYPIDRYVRYEATLTDNVCNNTTPYLYWVRLTYDDTASDDSIWSRIWQDKYGTHTFKNPPGVTFCPKDGTAAGNPPLNNAEIDSADTVWCYNLENYDATGDGEGPDNTIKVYVSTLANTIKRIDLRLGIRDASTLSTYPDPNTWPENIDDYVWYDWRPYERDDVVDAGNLDDRGDGIDTWLLTYETADLTTDFATEGGYILQSRAVSNDGGTEKSPTNFQPNNGDRRDTSIIYMMKDITPPGSTKEEGGWPGHAGESGYQPYTGYTGMDKNNDNWITDSLRIKGVQNTSPGPPPPQDWYINSENTWINFDSSQNDSGILVSVDDKNPDVDRVGDCSGLKEKSSSDSPTRYMYSTNGGDAWYRNETTTVTITNIEEWAECDTDYDTVNDIRYLALGNSKYVTPAETYSHLMPYLGPNSAKGEKVLIQFAQKDKAGNWGYSHPSSTVGEPQGDVGYYINYDVEKPKVRITAGPREANYSTFASFEFEDYSADGDDTAPFCAFKYKLEYGASETGTWFDYEEQENYQRWLPESDKDSCSYSDLDTADPDNYYRCTIEARDEALNVSAPEDSAVYVFQCLAPVPNTIIYSGPAGIVTCDDGGNYSATFKFKGEGGDTSTYLFAYKIDGGSWTLYGPAEKGTTETFTLAFEPAGNNNHTFRVRAANNKAVAHPENDPVGEHTDRTPACVSFTIEDPDNPSTIAPPSDPVKYWREESE